MTDESTKFQFRRARPYNHFLTALDFKLVFEPTVARFSYRQCLDQGKGWCENESVSRSILSDSFDPMDASLLGSSVHEILQARILEWVAMPFSKDLPNPGIEPVSPALQADSLLSEPPGKPIEDNSNQRKYNQKSRPFKI